MGADLSKRREFPQSVKLKAWERSGGNCEGCSTKLFPGKFQYDHTNPDASGGKPTLDNCKVLCSGDKDSCHYKKTYGTKSTKLGSDVYEIAKGKRLKRKHDDPKKSKHKWPKRSMNNARFKKKLDGTVERK